jgi:hypothetical protein
MLFEATHQYCQSAIIRDLAEAGETLSLAERGCSLWLSKKQNTLKLLFIYFIIINHLDKPTVKKTQCFYVVCRFLYYVICKLKELLNSNYYEFLFHVGLQSYAT